MIITNIEKINQFLVSSRIDGLPFLCIIYSPLCYNFWNQLNYEDIIFMHLSCIGFIYGMLINNYYDFENDSKYNPQKIGLDKKELSISTTVFGIMYIGLNIILSLTSKSLTYPLGAFSTYCFVTAYTPLLKPIPFVKNISTVAYMCFIPVYIFVKNHSNSYKALVISIPFSLLVLVREILLDINDIEEDKSDSILTLPVLFGERKIKTYLKIFVALSWIIGIAFKFVSIELFPIQVGLISGISSYALHRIDCAEKREFICGILFFYLMWSVLIHKDDRITLVDAFMGISIILYIISAKNYSLNPINPRIWNVFCRKLVHMGVGCMALSLDPNIIAYIVISFVILIRILLPKMSLGIEKHDTSLIRDTGIKCWLLFLLIWSIQNRNNPSQVYQKALPFFISDPSAAMVGRTIHLSNKVFLWNKKTLQGSLMVIMTVYALRRSIVLALGIGFAELFGGEYDNGLIGGILLTDLYFDSEIL